VSTELWADWHASGRPRAKLAPLMTAYQPLMSREVGRWSGSGLPDVALRAEARRLARKAFETYDPQKAELSTHLMTHLRGLDRYATTYRQEVRLPEAKAQLAGKVLRTKQDLEAELGRAPLPEEVSERLGIGTATLGKLKTFQTSLYSALHKADAAQPVREDISHERIAADFLYEQLSPMQKLVFRHTTGYGGAEVLRPGQIASRANVHPSRISGLKTEIAHKARRYQQAVGSLTG